MELGGSICIPLTNIISYLFNKLLKNLKLTVVMETFCKALKEKIIQIKIS